MTHAQAHNQGFTILVINPGSTSTKIALFQDDTVEYKNVIEHPLDTLNDLAGVMNQLELRETAIYDFIKENGIELNRLNAVVGRGGLLKPMPGGTYRISPDMLDDLKKAKYGEHASNLGALLAERIGRKLGIPAFIVDPVTTDEFEAPSRISGVPGVHRRSRSHALSIKAVAGKAAAKTGQTMAKTKFVVAHLGGGVSICALKHGRIIDSTDALLGEGPFSMERAGTIALERIIEMCFDRNLTREEIVGHLTRESGFKGYLNETDLRRINRRIADGEQQARGIMDAFVQQVAKWIGAMTTVLRCQVDAIIITGGMAHSDTLVKEIASYVEPLAPLIVFPGELEMEALAEGALRVLTGHENYLSY